ncbi:hypothetical protein [Gluconacetobacter diazotrophicus]|uniref:hypothetical protein n=1 Tax=Gluconacetobacter diazotrophicus TaxID=33996 RepID=UPI00119AF709|nr:hypothetical protein [Gluconacetobacter diazotrophicus]TWA98251.1 hypothetical protein FBZ86_14710 [Gluconacetobacter diazotrophicus]
MQQQNFVDANPAIGQKGTRITGAYMNNVNSELSNILVDLNITPDATKSDQISQALKATYAPITSPALQGVPTTTNPDGTVADQIATVDYVNQKALQATVGFTPVQQGGGAGMGSNKVYVGADSTDATNFLVQADSGASLHLTLGQDDTNTYGIRRFGFNHIGTGLVALDSNGTWHDIPETAALSNYLPLAGGTLTGALTTDGDVYSSTNTQNLHFGTSNGNTLSLTSAGVLQLTDSSHNVYASIAESGVSLPSSTTVGGNQVATEAWAASQYVPLTGGTVSGNLTTTGTASGGMILANEGIPNGTTSTGAGFSFRQDGNQDTGMFSDGDGKLYLYADSVKCLTAENGTLTSNVPFSAGSTTVSTLNVNGSAGTNRQIQFETNGTSRWEIITSQEAESGSNAGSNLSINRSDDSGNYLGTPLSISRSSGVINIQNGILVPTQSTSDNSQNAASTSYVKNNLSSYISGTYGTVDTDKQGYGLHLNGNSGKPSFAYNGGTADIAWSSDVNNLQTWVEGNYVPLAGNVTVNGGLTFNGTPNFKAAINIGYGGNGSGQEIYFYSAGGDISSAAITADSGTSGQNASGNLSADCENFTFNTPGSVNLNNSGGVVICPTPSDSPGSTTYKAANTNWVDAYYVSATKYMVSGDSPCDGIHYSSAGAPWFHSASWNGPLATQPWANSQYVKQGGGINQNAIGSNQIYLGW